jgi:hypothetical protein
VTVGVGAIVRCRHERIKAAAATREIHPCAPHAAGGDSPCMAGVDLEQHGGFAVEPVAGGVVVERGITRALAWCRE